MCSSDRRLHSSLVKFSIGCSCPFLGRVGEHLLVVLVHLVNEGLVGLLSTSNSSNFRSKLKPTETTYMNECQNLPHKRVSVECLAVRTDKRGSKQSRPNGMVDDAVRCTDSWDILGRSRLWRRRWNLCTILRLAGALRRRDGTRGAYGRELRVRFCRRAVDTRCI